MGVPVGQIVYTLGIAPCSGVGLTWTKSELDTAMQGPVLEVLFDDKGNLPLEELFAGLVDTEFAQERVRKVMKEPSKVKDWRVGEAIAEFYLTEYRDCTFPWPVSRDVRIAGSSLPGADLIGFGEDEKGACLAFGEVKTSSDQKYPPGLMYGRTGLKNQLEHLRDQESVRSGLLKYLIYRAQSSSWYSLLEAASRRYLQNEADVQIYGFLIRDVEPRESDLKTLVATLADSRPEKTRIELLAIYLPLRSIQGLGDTAVENRHRGGA